MPIYMKYDTIKGDVTEDTHKDWVELHSAQFGIGRGISAPTAGSAKDRESSAPTVSEIVCTKDMDFSSADLFQESLRGKGKPCEIDFVRSTQDQGMALYLKLTLTNTMISSYSTSSGGDKPTESLSLNFTKIEYKYVPTDEAHADSKPKIYTYDLATAKVS
jgi:type VI secretion system secreted protein Hcp